MGAWIQAIGGYLPLLRLDRAALAREFSWSGAALPRKGRRTVASWDEDTLTFAVEAARTIAGGDAPDALRIASTSAFFTDRAQSAIAVDALAFPRSTRSADHAGSRRGGTSALLDALDSGRREIVVASERRDARPGNASHLAFGDGAAAVRTGDSGSAELIAWSSLTHDFVDRYASREHPTSYAYEERFVRDVATAQILLPVVRDVCAKAGVDPKDLGHAAVAEPVAGTWAACAKALGATAPNHCAIVSELAGDLGTAHALYGLGVALAAASPGELVLVVGFGSGADAMIFRVAGPTPGAGEMRTALNEGVLLTSPTRFLNLTGSLDMDWGMRAEFEQKAQATVLERVGRDIIGFVGGRDSTGNVQFPKSAIPVNPELGDPESLADVRLADDAATIVSVTADRLNFTPDPPFDFGLVQFDNGARVLMEMVDRPAAGFAVGQPVRMRLRVKSHSKALGFRTYFWKAAPLDRPALEEA